MIDKYRLDMLSQDSVSVVKQTYIDYMGQEYPIGEPWRRSYANSEQGRSQVVAELPIAQVNAIMAVWGNTPTVSEHK